MINGFVRASADLALYVLVLVLFCVPALAHEGREVGDPY
jgi:hypothetical protein